MCGVWYENNQFGYNEIKIKGKLEQKQIYSDRLSSSGNLKAVVAAAWNSIKLFLVKGRKQTLISSTMLTAWRKTGNCDDLQASILSSLSFSGVANDWHDQPAERPPVFQTAMRNRTSLPGGGSRSTTEYITNFQHLHLPPLCVKNAYVHAQYIQPACTRANRAHFMAEQRPICAAQPAAAEVNSGWMDGRARGRNSRIVLHWRRNWLCSLG